MTTHFAREALLLAGLIATAASDAVILTVTNGANSGADSLRQAIVDAASGDTISFARDAGYASGYGHDQRGVPRPTDLAGVIHATGGDGSDIGAFEEGVLDVDGNGKIDALTDGLLLVRYLTGARGAALATGALGASPARTSTQIDNYIQALVP